MYQCPEIRAARQAAGDGVKPNSRADIASCLIDLRQALLTAKLRLPL
jgi:hypothetical protein